MSAVLALGLVMAAAPVHAADPAGSAVPEPLPSSIPGTPTGLTCGEDHVFPVTGLSAPVGAETGDTPESTGLRAAIKESAGDWKGLADLTWRMVGGGDDWVLFLAAGPADQEGFLIAADLYEESDGTWDGGVGQCRLRTVLAPDIGPATWMLDPSFPPPADDDTLLRLLVWEIDCSGGSSTTGRNAAPMVAYDDDAVTITLGVRPLPISSGGDALSHVARDAGDDHAR